MISELDNALRELLLRELPLKKGEVEISFDQPKRQWSSKLNKPSINIFLFDIKENTEYRRSEELSREKKEDGSVVIRRNPVRMDLIYILTAWTHEVQDEHHLLSAALMALLRFPYLPDELVPESLHNQKLPIHINIAQSGALSNITDMWSTMDNELHAGVRLSLTIAIDPYLPEILQTVKTTEWRFRQVDTKEAESEREEKKITLIPSKTYFLINGKITSEKFSPAVLRMVVKETGVDIPINTAGEFQINGLQAGEYHVDVMANDRILKEQKVQVPSSSYDIRV